MIDQMAHRFGRTFDHVVVGYDISVFQSPSGVEGEVTALRNKPYEKPLGILHGDKTHDPTSKGMSFLRATVVALPENDAQDTLMRQMKRFFPDGLVALRGQDVHAPKPLKQYTVLPQEAGILQLGAEVRLRHLHGNTYRIEKPLPPLSERSEWIA